MKNLVRQNQANMILIDLKNQQQLDPRIMNPDSALNFQFLSFW